MGAKEPTGAPTLWSLAGPMMGLNLLNILSLAVDSATCGRLPDGNVALAALGFSAEILSMLMVAMFGLVAGTVTLVSKAWGTRDVDRVRYIIGQSARLTVVIGAVVGVVVLVAAGPLLTVMGANDKVRATALAFLTPMLLSTPLSYLVILLGGAFRGIGNTRLPLVAGVLAVVMNAFFTYGLTLGRLGFPSLGVRGCALATVSSYVLNVVVLLWMLRRHRAVAVPISLMPQRIDVPLARQIYGIGVPAAIEFVMNLVSYMVLVAMLSRFDQLAVAAHGLGVRVQLFAYLPVTAISQATAALVGMSMGRKNVERAREVVRTSFVMSLMIITVSATTLMIFAGHLTAIFHVDSSSVLGRYAVGWIRLFGVSLIPASLYLVYVGALQGVGATKRTLRITLVAVVFVQTPLAAILAFGTSLGVWGVWISVPIASLVKFVLGWFAYRSNSSFVVSATKSE